MGITQSTSTIDLPCGGVYTTYGDGKTYTINCNKESCGTHVDGTTTINCKCCSSETSQREGFVDVKPDRPKSCSFILNTLLILLILFLLFKLSK